MMPLDQTGGRPPGRNVLGGRLTSCSTDPLTGFYRNGCCNTGPEDGGCHTVCAMVTAEFLRFSAERGNDLSTPRPEHGFPGLQPGDCWCLCAARWQEALQGGCAPLVKLDATEETALRYCKLEDLERHAAQC